MTGWISSSCKCQIEYSDDGNFTISKVINRCSRHIGLIGKAHFDAIVSDCALAHSRANIPLNAILNQSQHDALEIEQKKLKDAS